MRAPAGSPGFRRVVLKLSGEALMGTRDHGIDVAVVRRLAEEIVSGKRGVEDAREFYRKTEELAQSGKSSRYLDGLLFPVDNDALIDPERGGFEIR